MQLGVLASKLHLISTAQFDAERVVTSVTHDSRLACSGTIFVAVPGFRHDGSEFIPGAVANGANVVVTAHLPAELLPGVSYLITENVRATMATLAREIYGRPDEEVDLYGVTGTNGKTSTAYFLSAILEHAKRRVGVMGTIGFEVGGKIIETPNTTPEAPILHDLIRTAVDGGTEDIIMEVSSHSLELERVHDMVFDVAMFTNLTEDHLELHGTMENYYRAKKRLFGQTVTGHAVFDIGNPWGARAADEVEAAGHSVIRVGRAYEVADVWPENIDSGLSGTTFDLVTPQARVKARLRALGGYHVRNALLAAAAALAKGYSLETIVEGLALANPVTGRLQPVGGDTGLHIFIDYAHTTDALESCLHAVRDFSDRPITLVFGVLGDRIPRLRKEMGAVAAAGADHIILTEDDLKVSSLEEVVHDVGGALDDAGADWQLVENRWDAIAAGVARARLGDVVVVAGKGHEQQLILPDGMGVIHLDEVEAVKAALAGQNPRELDPRGSRGARGPRGAESSQSAV